MPIRLLLGLSLACLALPILAVPLPMLLDYPNHLARIWLLSGGLDQGPMAAFYELDWAALTNIGIDLLAWGPGRFVPATLQGPVYIWLGAALPVLGAALLNRRLFGGWSWWQLGFGIFAWNLTLLAGFLNFNIGVGMALLAAAAEPWVARQPGWAGFVLRLAVGFVLGVMHAFALFLYAAVLGGLALGPQARGWFGWPRIRTVLLAVAPAVAAVALLVVLAPALPGSHTAADAAPRSPLAESLALLADPGRKLRNGLAAIQTYRLKPDLLALLFLLVPLAWAAARGWLRWHAGLFVAVAGMAVLFLAFPDFAVGTGWLDRRFAQMGCILALVALRPNLPARFAPVLAAAMLLMVAGRTAWVGWVWWQRSADVAAVERALQPVPAGALVLPLEHMPIANQVPLGRVFIDGYPSYYHLPALAVLRRQAFVPTLFTARGKQPLAVRPAFQALAVPEGPLASVNALEHLDRMPWYRDLAPYVQQWERFDFALVLNADMPDIYGPVQLPAAFELVRDEGFAQLWRIRQPAVAGLR